MPPRKSKAQNQPAADPPVAAPAADDAPADVRRTGRVRNKPAKFGDEYDIHYKKPVTAASSKRPASVQSDSEEEPQQPPAKKARKNAATTTTTTAKKATAQKPAPRARGKATVKAPRKIAAKTARNVPDVEMEESTDEEEEEEVQPKPQPKRTQKQPKTLKQKAKAKSPARTSTAQGKAKEQAKKVQPPQQSRADRSKAREAEKAAKEKAEKAAKERVPTPTPTPSREPTPVASPKPAPEVPESQALPVPEGQVAEASDANLPEPTELVVVTEPLIAPPKRIGKAINARPKDRLTIMVCGDGDFGQFGMGSAPFPGCKNPKKTGRLRLNDAFLGPEKVGVVSIAVGGQHCAAITHDNKILTWGVNDKGALGRDTKWEEPLKDADNDEVDMNSDSESDASDDSDDGPKGGNPFESTPTAVDSKYFTKGTVFTGVACSDSATFAVTQDGKVYGWGMFRNEKGDSVFGQGIEEAHRPTHIKELNNITSLVCGDDFALALNTNGEVYAWGNNTVSQCGRKTCLPRGQSSGQVNLIPTTFGLGSKDNKIVSIYAGGCTGFAIAQNGELYSWGLNAAGQAGVDGWIEKRILSKLKENEDLKHIPEEDHTDDPTMKWEWKAERDVLTAPTIANQLKGYKIKELSVGAFHTLALTEDGDVVGFGKLSGESVGIPSKELPEDVLIRSRGSNLPFAVKIPQVIKAVGKCRLIGTGGESSAAVSIDNELWTWGLNLGHQLGTGESQRIDECNPVPTKIPINNEKLKALPFVFVRFGGSFGIFVKKADVAAKK